MILAKFSRFNSQRSHYPIRPVSATVISTHLVSWGIYAQCSERTLHGEYFEGLVFLDLEGKPAGLYHVLKLPLLPWRWHYPSLSYVRARSFPPPPFHGENSAY